MSFSKKKPLPRDLLRRGGDGLWPEVVVVGAARSHGSAARVDRLAVLEDGVAEGVPSAEVIGVAAPAAAALPVAAVRPLVADDLWEVGRESVVRSVGPCCPEVGVLALDARRVDELADAPDLDTHPGAVVVPLAP
ncbi:MAG: hypothetical protein UX74_C0010G0010 [Parcubacteria group bacterium GW2011_GWA2_47_10b]|nr:MAG: hypothetical protein UX74_C0010G0010 [Parcubacteria group bacterium GW2011_GWA2_47_10b]